ncbi:hypothetical protein KZX46_17695 [Polymorphobacter sp. PAMC 29334]|uniref:glycerophosphodiester phosphodiesterase family protein n=1 Tax=Polymorphobacter sp. PAMC 29334 TaxID=2862331 RepID=UPI001C776BF6|nr:glycerophosphodiester phosphodiesterase family protein [Polymorphobacter sp. PAMC 29334]QYE34574.1 hypothetical protein KZX46_17695 [Polymorphobacter sp. PAMC 29334]
MSEPVSPKPLLIAGATGYALWPANTLEATLRCLELPIDGIEIDVQLTSDGHVVAHHDYRFSADHTRLDGVWLDAASGPLKDMTLAELRRYDVGRTRPDLATPLQYPDREQMDGVHVPTLPELLAALTAASGPRRLLYVEIKTDPQNLAEAPAPELIVEAVFRDLEAAGYVDHAKIIAFDWQVLRLSALRSPGVMTAHLTIPAALAPQAKLDAEGRSPWRDGHDPAEFGSEMAAIKAHGGMEWSPYFKDVTADRIVEAESHGLRVGPWGLALGDDVRRMAELGVYSSTVSGFDWGADLD